MLKSLKHTKDYSQDSVRPENVLVIWISVIWYCFEFRASIFVFYLCASIYKVRRKSQVGFQLFSIMAYSGLWLSLNTWCFYFKHGSSIISLSQNLPLSRQALC